MTASHDYSSIISRKFLNQHSFLPKSIRTVLRAQILLTIHILGPITRLHIHSLGFKKTSMEKIVRELKADGLVKERSILLSTTKNVDNIINFILKNPSVMEWGTRITNYDNLRPLVSMNG